MATEELNIKKKINSPASNGLAGQFLKSNGDGTTSWGNIETIVTNGCETGTYADGIEVRKTGNFYELDCYGYLYYSSNPMTLPTLSYPTVSQLKSALTSLMATEFAADQPLTIIHSNKYYLGFIVRDADSGSSDYKVVYIDSNQELADAENNDHVFGTLRWTTDMKRENHYSS